MRPSIEGVWTKEMGGGEVDDRGNMGSLRNAIVFFHDEHRRAWSLSWLGTAAVPRDALVADLSEVARSFRLVRPPKQQKSWWKVW